MIDARFRIELPEHTWIRDVSQANPAATYRLLASVRTGDGRAIELGEVVAADPETAGRAVADHPDVTTYETLEADDERVLSRYGTTDTSLYDLLEAAETPPEFPVVVENGWYEFDLTGPREALDRFREVLEGLDCRYELLSLVVASDPSELLSARQRTVLDAALRAGYFEVPRGCTLAELAADLEVDKSAASRTLRRGVARVLGWYLTGTTGAVPRRS